MKRSMVSDVLFDFASPRRGGVVPCSSTALNPFQSLPQYFCVMVVAVVAVVVVVVVDVLCAG